MSTLELDTKSRQITDEDDNIIPLETAKQMHASGLVAASNMSFWRLVTLDWNFAELDRYYADQEAFENELA